jgi:hypothetical protein
MNKKECKGCNHEYSIENYHPVSCRIKEEIKTENCPFRKGWGEA